MRGIFVQRLIAAIVQAVLDVPVLAHQAVEACGAGCLCRQTGEAQDHLLAFDAGVRVNGAALELEDLATPASRGSHSGDCWW